jgi:twitching motility protein PilT
VQVREHMSLVASLLQAIVRLDGEALVMHVGEKPYVVSPTGQTDLATRALTLEAVVGMVGQLLSSESQRALGEFGAVQYEIPAAAQFAGEHFTVVAARGGDDVWVEIRRHRVPEDDRVPADLWAVDAPAAQSDPERTFGDDSDLSLPDESQLWPDAAPLTTAEIVDLSVGPVAVPTRAPAAAAPPPRRPQEVSKAVPVTPSARLPAPPPRRPQEVSKAVPVMPPARLPAPPLRPQEVSKAVPVMPSAPPSPVAPSFPVAVSAPAAGHTPAVVLPLSRSPIRPGAPPPLAGPAKSGLDRLLRIAAARGASTLYLSSQARPSIRVDGEIWALESEPPLGPSEVESLLIDLMPERNREALRSGVGTEWICDVVDVGRVRCMSFRDHQGAGGIFRMMPVRVISAEQLGLSREIQALAAEPEGLVLVTGPRSSGKSTLISACVDLINRSRREHVITVESEIKVVHDHRSSFVSQREVRGSNDEMLTVVRGAIRENPDVLVLEEMRTPEIVSAALEAAASGLLVIGALPAHTTTGAVDRIIDFYPPEQRRSLQMALAENLRGIVAQVLLRKPGGGRVAAREVLLNTPAVSSAIAEGKTSQLPLAIEGGRKYGMVPLNDALVGFVQGGVVEAREAYRRANDRAGFLALLKRQGIDTSFVERLA